MEIMRVINDELIDLREYRNANAAFNTNEYCKSDDICIFHEQINPFDLYYENKEKDKEIEKLKYKLKSIVYTCYESDMSYEEFKQVWVNAFSKLYDPKDIKILEKELKGSDEE